MLDELEGNGVVLNRDNRCIQAGPEHPHGMPGQPPKRPRIVIPKNPGKFEGFPAMDQYKTATQF